MGMDCFSKLKVFKLDLETYTKDFNNAKKNADDDKASGYYMFYFRQLDYVVPIAIQAPIVVSIDFEGNIVNDVFNMNSNYHPSDLHLCILPLKESTVILLFVKEGDKTYRRFRKQFQKLDDDSKLGAINYLVFLYTEDYFMAKELRGKIDFKVLKETVNIMPIIWDTAPISDTKVLSEKFNLSNWMSIPNLLSPEYKLR